METAINQISRIIETASIKQTFDAGLYTCVSDINVVNDSIRNIILEITPKDYIIESRTMQMNVLMPPVNYYARAEWNISGQTSYYYSDTTNVENRKSIIDIFDSIFDKIKNETYFV